MKKTTIVLVLMLICASSLFASDWLYYRGMAVTMPKDIAIVNADGVTENAGTAVILCGKSNSTYAFSLTVTLADDVDFTPDYKNKTVMEGDISEPSRMSLFNTNTIKKDGKELTVILLGDEARNMIWDMAYYRDLAYLDIVISGDDKSGLMVVRVSVDSMYKYI